MSQKSQDAIDVLSEVIVDTIDKKLGTAKFDKSQTGVVTAVNGNTYTIAVFGSQYNITSDQIFTVGQSVVVTALQGDMKRLVCSPDNVGTMKTVDSKVKVVGDQLSSFIDKDFADTVIRYTDVGKFFNIKDGRAVEDNWTATGSHKGQGTSSNAYGESGRNIDIDCSGGFTFGDESTGSKYAFTENSVGEKYFNIKVNVASSENANNALLADEFNEFNPYIRQARKDNPKVRDTMAFYPCVIFIQETDTTNATVFKDGQWHFYACGDFGNSKKNSETMGMDPNNHKEVIVEIDNNTDAQTRFLSGDFSEETWDGDHSFEFRYINKNCSEQEIQDAKNAWIRVQNWVVNADDAEFKKNFENYFIKDAPNGNMKISQHWLWQLVLMCNHL